MHVHMIIIKEKIKESLLISRDKPDTYVKASSSSKVSSSERRGIGIAPKRPSFQLKVFNFSGSLSSSNPDSQHQSQWAYS